MGIATAFPKKRKKINEWNIRSDEFSVFMLEKPEFRVLKFRVSQTKVLYSIFDNFSFQKR